MKRLLSVLALVLAAAFLASPSALAHSALDSSNPKDGATLEAPPTEIVLTFNEQLLENTVKVIAHLKGEKSNVLDDIAQADGKTVRVPWPQDAPGGEYEVAFRIVSADGHPVTGTLTFSYAAAPASSPAASTPPPTSASASAPASAVPLETVTASPTAAADSTSGASSSTSPLPVIIIGLVIGIVIGLVIFFVARKRA